MERRLLLGNEAVALGALHGGVLFASAYPGTPSTEITENIAKYEEIYSEWAPNEKVALEAAMGAAVGGARSIVAMKHVGVNVAADPLFTASYTGINAGLVLVVGDDPGMHSSQNEQDTKFYGRASLIPVLEPSDSQEAYDFTRFAFELSEAFDVPVIIRLTTRIAHSRTLVTPREACERTLKDYQKNYMKYVMMPGMAKLRHKEVIRRTDVLTEAAGTFDINKVIEGSSQIGIITSSMSYQYVREALPEASVLKLGMVYPLNEEQIKAFAAKVEKLYVVEEGEPFIEDAVRAMGVECVGKALFPKDGELSIHLMAQALGGQAAEQAYTNTEKLPARPPVLCPGCPHRGTFYTLKKMGLTVTGDIGCYTLGTLPPLESIDTVLCMGASIGMAHGMEKARGREFARKLVAVIGDSTFIHSGITGLIEAVYNNGNFTVVIMDNSITGMTGHQHNPTTGYNIKGDPATSVDLEALCRSVGVASVAVADPFDVKAFEAAVRNGLNEDGISVVIARRPCALLKSVKRKPAYTIDPDICRKCGLCLKPGCPAIGKTAAGMKIDPSVCTGCGLCQGICPFGAIKEG